MRLRGFLPAGYGVMHFSFVRTKEKMPKEKPPAIESMKSE